jgi:hypothetical protein
MLFTSLGLLLTNYLLYVSRYIPRAISIWGLAAIFLLLMPVLLQLYDRDLFRPAMILAIPYASY